MPLTLTLFASVTAPERRGVALGLWGGMGGVAVGVGPVVGGWVTEYASWQWIFWINVPIGVILLPVVAGPGESRGAGRLDPVGVLTAGLFGVVFGLVRGKSHGWTSGQVLVLAGRRRDAFSCLRGLAGQGSGTDVAALAVRDRGFTVVNAVRW